MHIHDSSQERRTESIHNSKRYLTNPFKTNQSLRNGNNKIKLTLTMKFGKWLLPFGREQFMFPCHIWRLECKVYRTTITTDTLYECKIPWIILTKKKNRDWVCLRTKYWEKVSIRKKK